MNLTMLKKALAFTAILSMFGFLSLVPRAGADVDPGGCTDNGGGISISAFRFDGVTPIAAASTVTDGEMIKYQATLFAAPPPNCAFEFGTWTLTTPDGVVHPLGVVPRIGGLGVSSTTSALIPYTVSHGDEIVNSTRRINAITSYGGGKSHADNQDETDGPTLGASKITRVVHLPIVTTIIHDSNHLATTSVPVGMTVHDEAVVTGEVGGPAPTGTASFNLYSNSVCEGATTTQAVALATSTNTGIAESSNVVAGTNGLSYKVYYNGDSNYLPAWGICEELIVTKLTPNVTTDIHNVAEAVVTSVPVGTTVHDSATVTGSGPTPTGNVEFTFYSGPGADVCDAQSVASGSVALNGGGVAHPSSSQGPLSAGSYAFRAFYLGDENYNSGWGPCEPLTVTKATPGIQTVQSAGGPIGTILNDTATISGGSSPTGNVTFKLFPPSDATCSGVPVYTDTDPTGPYATSPGYASLVAGTYRWTADYAGDDNNEAVSSGCQDELVIITEPQVVQGCSPGYWKQSQHFGSYPTPTTYPNSLFTSVGFENAFPGQSLLQVLNNGGGGLNALGRHIVGAYLNAATIVGFPYTSAQVVADFNAVFPGGDYNTLKSKYEALQDPCPFGLNPGPAYQGGPIEKPGKGKKN